MAAERLLQITYAGIIKELFGSWEEVVQHDPAAERVMPDPSNQWLEDRHTILLLE